MGSHLFCLCMFIRCFFKDNGWIYNNYILIMYLCKSSHTLPHLEFNWIHYITRDSWWFPSPCFERHSSRILYLFKLPWCTAHTKPGQSPFHLQKSCLCFSLMTTVFTLRQWAAQWTAVKQLYRQLHSIKQPLFSSATALDKICCGSRPLSLCLTLIIVFDKNTLSYSSSVKFRKAVPVYKIQNENLPCQRHGVNEHR